MTELGAAPPISERRNLTVLMVDMVGSTSLSEEYDPEDVDVILREYRRLCFSHVIRFNGKIVNFVGDAVAACFGWPRASENDAERAVLGAIGILQAVKELEILHHQRVRVRIGIATGLVVARETQREDGTKDIEIIGMAPNLASRLDSHAELNGMLICPVTASLVGGRFRLRKVGPLAIKGLTSKVTAFAVEAERPLLSRFEGRSGGDRGFSLVGRDYQLQELVRSWEAVKAHHGRMVFVVGEGGIGKSCLVQALLHSISAESHVRMILQCSPFHMDTPLHPVVRALRQAWGITNEDNDASALVRIRAGLAEYGFDSPDHWILMAMLLDLGPSAAGFEIPNDSPGKIRRRMLDFLVAYLLRIAERQPVVVVLEDGHWIDPSTRSLMEMAGTELEARPILAVVTTRPPIIDHRTLVSTTISLHPLPRDAVHTLAKTVAGGKTIPRPVLELISSRTDGVPLFVEEVTKALLESGALIEADDQFLLVGELDQIDIPTSLNDILDARVDHAHGAKNFIQAAACIGREFSIDLLSAAMALPGETVEFGVRSLAQSGLIERQGDAEAGSYAFSHLLIQQAAHEMLLRSERRLVHGRIAEALAELQPNLRETQPEELARHLLEANRPVDALPLFEAAGARAADRSAYVEAVSHFRRSLQLVEKLDDDHQRYSAELRLLMQIGPALMALRGYADETVASTYRRALQLLDGLVERDDERTAALFGLWTYYVVSNQLSEALSTGNRLYSIAAKNNNEDLLLEAHVLLAVTHFARGTVARSLEHSRAALRIYHPARHRHHARVYGQEPGMAATTFLSIALWWLGQEAEGLRASEQALDLARESNHPFSIAFCLSILARLHMLRGDAPKAWELASQAAKISDEQVFPVWGATATIVSGWAEAQLDDDRTKGLQKMRAGIRAYAGLGSRLSGPLYEALLLELEDDGPSDLALERIRKIRRTAEASEGLGDYVELMRIEAAVLRRSGDLEGAEQELRTALARATEMSALAWLVRIALDLGEVLLETGRGEEGLALVERAAGRVDPAVGSPILDRMVSQFKKTCESVGLNLSL